MELSCDVTWKHKTISDIDLNVDVREFKPKRNAAAIAECHIQDQVVEEEQEN